MSKVIILALAVLTAAIIFRREISRLLRRNSGGQRFAGVDLKAVRSMDWLEFEHYLGHLFERLGYTVQITSPMGDFGADLIVTEPGGRRIAVQAKHWRRQGVGVEAVQAVAAASLYYGCQEHVVITTSWFTFPAQKMARKIGTKLWGLRELAALMQQVAARGGSLEPPELPEKIRAKRLRTVRRMRRPRQESPAPVPPVVTPIAGQVESKPVTSPPATEAAPGVQAAPAAQAAPGAQAAPATQTTPARPAAPARAAAPRAVARPAAPPSRPEVTPTPIVAAAQAPACPQCGTAMQVRYVMGREVWVCARFPACKGALLKDQSEEVR